MWWTWPERPTQGGVLSAFGELMMEARLADQDWIYDSMDYASSGIDNLDVPDLEKATALIASCGTKVAELREMLETYVAQSE